MSGVRDHSESGAPLVWCLLHGRLGNNLFQYAAAATWAGAHLRKLQPEREDPREHGRPARVGVGVAAKASLQTGETPVLPALGNFRRCAPWAAGGKILMDYSKTGTALTRRKIAQEDFYRLGLPGIVVPPLMNRIVHRVMGCHLYQLGILPRIGDAGWDEPSCCRRKSVILEGYFQRASTAENAPEGFRKGLLERLGTVAGSSALKPEGSTVAVHVRRGDYLPHDTRVVCGLEYFRQAMQCLRKVGGPWRFLVFSDDPAWCVEHLSGSDVDFAPPEVEEDAIAALHRMALCRHQIISNSTFSWWAGWLNPHPDKIVVGPDRWDSAGAESIDAKRFAAYHTLAEIANLHP